MEQKTHLFKVEMTCEGCSGAVQRVLNKRKGDGIENVDISLEDQTVQVVSNLPIDELLEMIKKTGKPVEHISSS